MTTYDSIVNPVKSKKTPDIGPVAVIAATEMDLFLLCDLFRFNKNEYRRLFTSRLYAQNSTPEGVCLTGEGRAARRPEIRQNRVSCYPYATLGKRTGRPAGQPIFILCD